MEDIRIDVGIDTLLEVDLTDIDFEDAKEVVFTMKNAASIQSEVIVERKFTEPKVHKLTITAEESTKIRESAVYDFQKILKNGDRIKITDNGGVYFRYGVGDKID